MLVWLFFVVTYYFFLVWPIAHYKGLESMKDKRKAILCMAGIALIIGFIISDLISSERFIYFWDNAGYYKKAINMASLYGSNPGNVLKDAWRTSATDNYGSWSVAIAGYPFKFTNRSYVAYILILYAMFALPSAFSVTALISSLFQSDNSHWYAPVIIFLVVLSMPWFLKPMLSGYPGICALLPMACSLWILFKSGFKDMRTAEAVSLSLSLIFPMILRRYFGFWVVGFVAGSLAYSACSWIMEKSGKDGVIHYLKNYILVGAFSLLVLAFGFKGFLRRTLLTDYSSMYVAYNRGGNLLKYGDMLRHLGLVLVAVILTGVVLGCIRENKKNLPLIFFCVVFEIFSTLFFFRVQNPGTHHYWIFLLPLLLTIGLTVNSVMDVKSRVPYYVLMLLMCGNSLYVYTGSYFPNVKLSFFQQDRYYITQREDYEEAMALADHLVELQGDSRKVYCTESNSILNSSILENAYLPKASVIRLAGSADIDLRDGFPTGFLDADIVVATNKDLTHTVEGSQMVITLLNEEFNNPDSRIARHFVKEETFHLQSEVDATVYVRQEPYTADDVAYLRDLYQEHYPDRPDLFYDRFQKYIEDHF